MAERQKPIEPSKRALRVAQRIAKDLLYQYTGRDVLRIARRIAHEYERESAEAGHG